MSQDNKSEAQKAHEARLQEMAGSGKKQIEGIKKIDNLSGNIQIKK